MSTVESLSHQLLRYKRLKFHHNRPLTNKIIKVQRWQIQRMKTMHAELFNQPGHRALAGFLLKRLYSLKDMRRLAHQLNKALTEHIKLEKFLPESVRATAELGLELAFITLYLDEQIAIYCLSHGDLELTEDILCTASLELDHFKMRQQQLMLLTRFGEALHAFGKSFLIQSAFKLAKRTAYNRGFSVLYDYLDEGFHAVKAAPSAQQFFAEFTAQEAILMQRVKDGYPNPFQSMLKSPVAPV